MPGRRQVSGSLPQAGETYDRKTFQELLDYITELEGALYFRDNHLEVWAPPGPGGRQPLFVLRSPNGTRFSVQVDNAGVLSTVDIGTQGQQR